VPSLQALIDSRHEVVAVITRPDAPAGRGRTLHSSPIAELAVSEGIDVLKPTTPRDPAFIDALTAIAPDCCPVVAYGALIPRRVLDIPTVGWVNLHFSLLPAWRGAAPVQHSLRHGDDVTGATTFLLEEGMDTGPVFGLITETIRPTDTSGDLLQRLSISGADLLVRTLDGIEDGTLTAIPQAAEGISMAPKISVDDARVDWTHPAMGIDRLVRSCTPAPGSWTTFRGERIKLGPLTLVPDVTDLSAGQLRVMKQGVWVGTGSHVLSLNQVQPVGKKMMSWRDWSNGARPTDGELFA